MILIDIPVFLNKQFVFQLTYWFGHNENDTNCPVRFETHIFAGKFYLYYLTFTFETENQYKNSFIKLIENDFFGTLVIRFLHLQTVLSKAFNKEL